MNNTLQWLIELAATKQRERYPSIPEHARPRPKYNDKTANGLTRCIIDFIHFKNGQAERINNTGRIIDQRQTFTDAMGYKRTIGSYKWVKGTGTNGTADISSTINGRSVKIEVKIGADIQSAAQTQYQREVERAGGLYFIAKDFDTFYRWYAKTFE